MLVHLLRRARWALGIALCASAVGGLSKASLVALINRAFGAPQTELAKLGAVFVVLAVLIVGTHTLSEIFFVRLGQRAKAELATVLARKVADTAYPRLERQGSARGMTALIQDIDAVVLMFVELPFLTMHASVVAGCLLYLGMLSWQVLLLALSSILAGAVGFHFANSRSVRHLHIARSRQDDLSLHFRGLFDGAKELRLNQGRKHAYLSELLSRDIEEIRAHRSQSYVLSAFAHAWGNGVFLAFMGSVIFVFSRMFAVDDRVMSGYALIILYMIPPVGALLAAIPSVLAARVALQRLEQLSDQLPPEPGGDAPMVRSFRSISLRGVGHSYYREGEDSVFTLGPIDLTFRPGELVFLVGGNGSGKTTLAKLLTGLYAPERGTLCLDGKPLGEADRSSYRQLFSAIFSDFFLFESLLGFPAGAMDARAGELLRELQLDRSVQIKDGRFSTTALSQGQRKRLALLMAYLDDKPFCVFDEWAADQDPTFREVFYRKILPALQQKGKTVLAISHDDRYFALADRCIKLDYGRLLADDAADPAPTKRTVAIAAGAVLDQ
jgi:putative pyoverdin transport system ATP-binding/permease protein